MKQAVMYGGGNIGRGFIGALFSQSGYRVTFVDVAEPVVEALQTKNTYPVRYVSGEGYEDVWIQNVTAVNGMNTDAVAETIAACDIMATAVGARILPFIVPNIVAGLRKRWQQGSKPLNIIICENLLDANKVLEGMLKAELTPAEQEKFDQTVGLVEASIGRMVPVQTPEMQDGEPLRVCVEKYGFLPVDKEAFCGEIPEIQNMVPFAPFDFYIRRKLYVHNMGHAVCAYLGDLLGLTYIWQAIALPEIRIIVHNAMLDSAAALSQKYNLPLFDLQMHIVDLLGRFGNKALGDTCQRVGGDPARKLSPEDRLVGAAKLCYQQGITPCYLAVGAAAGIQRYLQEAEDKTLIAETVVETVCKLSLTDPLAEQILEFYREICNGATIPDLLHRADKAKQQSLQNVI